MSNSCANHDMERATATCLDCGRELCDRCLVPPDTPGLPVVCVPCALARVGTGYRRRPRERRRRIARRS